MIGRLFPVTIAAGLTAIAFLSGFGSFAAAQAPTATKQPYFAPKRVLLLSAAQLGAKNRNAAGELEAVALQSLKNLFAAPSYRPVSDGEAIAALETAARNQGAPDERVSTEGARWLAERPSEQITAALVEIGKAAGADTAVFAVVKKANGEEVVLAVWSVDVQSGAIVAAGKTLRQGWNHLRRPASFNPGSCHDAQIILNDDPGINPATPLNAPTTRVSADSWKMDRSHQKILIGRLLTAWSTSLH